MPDDDAARPEVGSYDRRTFVVRGGSLTAFVFSGGLGAVLSACGGGAEGGSGAQVQGGAATVEEDVAALARPSTIYGDLLPELPRGGTIEIGLSEQVSNTLDPLVNSLGATQWMSYPAHDFLEMYDHDGVLRPSLAETLEFPDARSLRYRLHENAAFHNGRRVTSDDVRKTFAWIQDAKNASWLSTFVEGVRVETPDERTVVLRLPAQNASFRHSLVRIPIVPVEAARRQATEPVGCGPFRFSRFVRDSYVEYEPFEDFWNSDTPRVDRLRLTLFSEAQAAGEAFLAGRTAYLSQVPNAQVPSFRSRADSEGFETDVIESGFTYLRFYRYSKKPWSDVRVRRAVALALDREGMAQTAFNGIARPFWAGPVAPESPYYTKELEYERDVETAQQLLSEAGLGSGFDGGKITTVQIDYFQDLAVTVQANLKDIGIETEIEAVDLPTYIDQRNRGRLNLGLLGDEVSPDPSDILSAHFARNGTRNIGGYRSPEVDRLLRQARAVVSIERRAPLFQAAMRLIYAEDYAALPLTAETTMGLYRHGTNGDQYHPSPRSLWHYPIVSVEA